MTRQALAQDRGLQAERTALAWTRTALAIAASGVLVLLHTGGAALSHDPARVTVVVAAAVLAAGVFVLGAQRRGRLARGQYSAVRYLPAVGIIVAAQGALVLTYLAAS